MNTFLLVSAVIIPLFGSVVSFIWGHKSKRTVSIVSTVFSGFTLATVISLYVLFNKGQLLRAGLDVGLPFQLALKADSLGLFLSLITTAVWFLVAVYSIEYIHERKGLFACFLLLSLYGILGITLAENLFTLLIFFEIFSIASAILIIHELTEKAIRAGFQYLFISVVGTACLIVGSAILFSQTGSLDLLGSGIKSIPTTSIGVLTFWLLIVGFAIKAGAFPVHIWLPEAHPIAPSSASALLSGVMIKAGVYGIIRVIYGVYGGQNIVAPYMSSILITVAVITMIGGSLAAITQTELKRMLAFSSIAQIGYVLLGAALISATALTGGVLHILNHALMKSALFLAAGAIIHKTGKRELADLKGIGRQMPLTMTVITLAAISMIGVPPFVGFFSKWLLATGSLEAVKAGVIAPWAAYAIVGFIILSGLLNAVYYGPIIIGGWFGARLPDGQGKPKEAHGYANHGDGSNPEDTSVVHGLEPSPKQALLEPSWVMVSPMLILAISTLALGIYIKYPLKLVASVVKLYF